MESPEHPQQHANDESEAATATSNGPRPRPSQPTNRACESCRALKVRCLPGSGGDNPRCQRCLKYDRHCYYAQQVRKKPRKRTDARVALLEKEITAMRSLLERNPKQSQPSPPSAGDSSISNSANSPSSHTGASPRDASAAAAMVNHPSPQSDSSQTKADIVDRGVMSLDEAFRLIGIFQKQFTPHFPLVILPTSTDLHALRKTEPLTFHAMITAASSIARPDLLVSLNAEAIQDFAQRVMITGEKSLDVVRAMNINAAWYLPLDRSFSALKYFELAHIAATLAVNSGLGDRDTAEDSTNPVRTHRAQLSLLACYLQCSTLSIMRRQPNFLRFSSYMSDIVQDLEASASTTEVEQILCAYARLINIGEEMQSVLSLCDSTRNGPVSEVKQQQDIMHFSRKLRIWTNLYKPENRSSDLVFMYHYLLLVLHETPLHRLYAPSFFRPPFVLSAPKALQTPLTQTDNRSLTIACSEAHAMLDVWLSQSVEWIRSLPGHIPARVTYALTILIGITFTPQTPGGLSDPQTHLEFHREMTQLDNYVDAVIDKILQAAAFMEYKQPTIFAGPLIQCKKWLRWAYDRGVRGDPIDGGLKYSLFGGPEDHPALLATGRTQSTDSTTDNGGGSAESILRPFTGASPSATSIGSHSNNTMEDTHDLIPKPASLSPSGLAAYHHYPSSPSDLPSSNNNPQQQGGTQPLLPSQYPVSTMVSGKNTFVDFDWPGPDAEGGMLDFPILSDDAAGLFASEFEFGDMANAFEGLGAGATGVDLSGIEGVGGPELSAGASAAGGAGGAGQEGFLNFRTEAEMGGPQQDREVGTGSARADKVGGGQSGFVNLGQLQQR